MIKAIETHYNGYRFRSRLEARWAVFFDAMDIDYQYESEGFILQDGTSYLPDFYLPTAKIWVEVKPFIDDERGSHDRALAMSKMMLLVNSLPGSGFTKDGGWGLVIFGEPYLGRYSMFLMSPDQADWSNCVFVPCKRGNGFMIAKLNEKWDMEVALEPPGCSCSDRSDFVRHERVMLAYDRASGARFEHGERP